MIPARPNTSTAARAVHTMGKPRHQEQQTAEQDDLHGPMSEPEPALSSSDSALGLLSLWNKSRVGWRLLITAIARYPLVSPGRGPARLKHGTVRVMATKAERRAARERVSAYHESQLAGLLGHVGQRSTATAPARSTPMPRMRRSTTTTVPPQNSGSSASPEAAALTSSSSPTSSTA